MTEGHNEPCYYCGEKCDSLAGNPSKWPIPLAHSDEPGKVKWHHIGCVSKRLRWNALANGWPEPESLVVFGMYITLQDDPKVKAWTCSSPVRIMPHHAPTMERWTHWVLLPDPPIGRSHE